MILFLYFFIIFVVNINCYDDYYTVENTLELVRGSSVDTFVSSEDVIYCKLISPRGFVFYDDFGRCRLSLDRVEREHHGDWDKLIGYPGSATLKTHHMYIKIIERGELKTEVHTAVEESSPNIMTMTCSLPTGYEVRGCKFRGKWDLTFLASGTTATIVKAYQTEYDTVFNSVVYYRFEARLEGSACSLQITDPRIGDLGFWRCAMYTEQDTYYGFLTLLSSWYLNQTSVVQTIRRGPLLRADHDDISVNKGEPVTVSCSIDAPIRYCYFWMSDGTVFNVFPGLNSSSMEYVGSGFDAGECGLKVHDLSYANMGRRWSCNVGLATGRQQSRDFFVNIRDRMQVSQQSYGSYEMTISARLVDIVLVELEYCRYVQDDGFGFSHDNLPSSSYEFTGSLFKGSCDLRIEFPNSWSDYRPWTIIAKVKGEGEEISGRTRGLPYPPNQLYSSSPNGWIVFGWVLLSVVLAAVLLGVALGPQRNRKWIQRRATIVRESLRRQQPPPYTPTI